MNQINGQINNGSQTTGSLADIYLYHIPYPIRRDLCHVMDELNIWEQLAIHMGYKGPDIQDIKRTVSNKGRSPSDELITLWGEQNHTVTELFILLARMYQYPVMEILKKIVDVKYHKLIVSGQPDLSVLLSGPRLGVKTDSPNNNNTTGTKSQSTVSEKILNSPVNMYSDENNESKRQINPKLDKHSDTLDVDSSLPQINYIELVEATNNWSDNNVLGKGGFGKVYRGMWKNTIVAIKRIEYRGTGSTGNSKIQMEQSLNELRYLNSCRHDNILAIYGYSNNGEKPCLIYQLMSGGSLEQRLSPNTSEPLDCHQRVKIAQGTARGLQFLHTLRKKPLIHGDIKPANILLDPCCVPKIGDFGLAREGPNTLNSSMEVSKLYGTRPYLPVEFLGLRSLSTKLDTYSFGIVLYELATGLKAYDAKRERKYLFKHIQHVVKNSTNESLVEELMDKTLIKTQDSVLGFTNLIELGRICSNERADERPEMVDVLRYLERINI